jgi:hypothetical protein
MVCISYEGKTGRTGRQGEAFGISVASQKFGEEAVEGNRNENGHCEDL